MKEIFSKILLCVFSAIVFGLAGFAGLVIAALSGADEFYLTLIMVGTGALIIFIILKVFALVKPKPLKILFLSFLGICVLSVGGYEVNKAYHNSFSQVNEQGVNLDLYKPFAENTKAVKLEEESTLKLEEQLPRLDGATALYPLYSAFAQAVYPERDYDIYAMKYDYVQGSGQVVCSTTVGAYASLINGEADIIFVARPSAQQLEDAKRQGVELKLTPIGKEAFVFFVNSQNEVKGLSTAQIQDIYAGKITNWQEVGGKNEKIRAFQRPENSGSQTMLQKLMEGKNLMVPPKEDVVEGMGGIIERTANYRNYKNAMGYSFLFFATEMIQNNEIKLLEVDGVSPNKDTIAGGEYPLSADIYAVTAGGDNPNMDRFIEWILSAQGQYLVEQTGYTPINQ